MVAESFTSPRPPETNGVSGCACGTINDNLARVRAQFHFEEMGRGKRAGRWRAVMWPHLHIDDGSMGGGGPIPHVNSIQNAGIYRNDPNYFNPNRDNIFYYCVIVHDLTPAASGRGCGDRFALAGNILDTSTKMASTFMHELGHCIEVGDYDVDLDGDGILDPNEDDDGDGSWEDYCEDKNCAMIDYGWPVNYCSHHWSQVDLSTVG